MTGPHLVPSAHNNCAADPQHDTDTAICELLILKSRTNAANHIANDGSRCWEKVMLVSFFRCQPDQRVCKYRSGEVAGHGKEEESRDRGLRES